MKIVYLALILLVLAGVATWITLSARKTVAVLTYDEMVAAFNKIKPGDTKEQVVALIGEPATKDAGSWNYDFSKLKKSIQQETVFIGPGIGGVGGQYFTDGTVSFKENGTVEDKRFAWFDVTGMAPDSSNLNKEIEMSVGQTIQIDARYSITFDGVELPPSDPNYGMGIPHYLFSIFENGDKTGTYTLDAAQSSFSIETLYDAYNPYADEAAPRPLVKKSLYDVILIKVTNGHPVIKITPAAD